MGHKNIIQVNNSLGLFSSLRQWTLL